MHNGRFVRSEVAPRPSVTCKDQAWGWYHTAVKISLQPGAGTFPETDSSEMVVDCSNDGWQTKEVTLPASTWTGASLSYNTYGCGESYGCNHVPIFVKDATLTLACEPIMSTGRRTYYLSARGD